MITYVLSFLYLIHSTNSVLTRQPSRIYPFSTPEEKALKKALGYMEDTYLNFTELTAKYGYSSEQHIITTEDLYQLTVFRILTKCAQVQRFPVLLGHGIYDSSDGWILTGPKTGLGYILSNNCYDVWAVNYRGNVYSRKHLRLDPDKDAKYWDFSFDENGNYDVPAVVDYILDATKQSKVYYIGHSQGTTDFLIMGSLKPEYNKKIQLSILLAPIAWMKNIRVPILKFLSSNAEKIKNALEDAGINEILAKHQLIHIVSELLCQFAPNEVCGTALSFSTGYRKGSISSKNLSVAIGHLLLGTSIKSLAHFAQLIVSGNFQRYDEGEEGNIRRYGSVKTPEYDVSLITCPVVVFSAENDWLSTLEDIEILTSRLPHLVENYIIPEPTWSHNNHIWGINATELEFERILYYLQTFNMR